MRRPVTVVLALLLLLGAAARTRAQAFQWVEYTDAQRWERSALMGVLSLTTAIAYAKERGSTAEQFGKWYADRYVGTWGQPGAYGPQRAVAGWRRNFLTWPNAIVEILSDSDASVTARFSRPWLPAFGANSMVYGVTPEDVDLVFSIFMKRVAEHHGLTYQERREGEDLVVTYARK